MQRCPSCGRLYSCWSWFKAGEDPEYTLRELDGSGAAETLAALAAVGSWALRRPDGTWILHYAPTKDEVLPLLTAEERQEVEVQEVLEARSFSLDRLEETLRLLHSGRARVGPWLRRLEDDAVWLRLDSDDDEHLWRGRGLGLAAAFVKKGRIASIEFWHDLRVRDAVLGAVRRHGEAALEAVDATRLARLRSIDTAAARTLAHIDSGAAWTHRQEDVLRIADGHYYAVRERMREAVPLDGLRLREWLAEAARRRASLDVHPLPAARRRRLEEVLHPARQLEAVRSGRLTLCGSAGSVLHVEGGHFCYAGTQPRQTLTAGEVQAVLDDGRYAWLRWT